MARNKQTTSQTTSLPDFDGLDTKKLLAAAAKIQKKADADHWKVGELLSGGTGVEYERRGALAWHLIRHGALAAERHLGLLDFLAENTAHEADPVDVAELCTRLPSSFQPLTKKGWSFSALLDEYPVNLDALVVRAYHRDREAFRSRIDRMQPNIRRAVHLAQGRCGEALAPADAAEILDQLARGQANDYAICSNIDVTLERDGELVEHRLRDLDQLTVLAERFGAREAWVEALLRHTRTGNWGLVRHVHLALVHTTAAEAAALLASRSSFHDSNEMQAILDLFMKDRSDPPEALVEAALAIPIDGEDSDHARDVREVVLFCAIHRFQALGREVPPSIDEALELRFFPCSGYTIFNPFALAALRAMPRDRVIAMARRLVEAEIGFYRAGGPLAAHFDQKVFDRCLARCAEHGYLPHEIIAQCGAPALPALLDALGNAKGDKKRPWHRMALECLATMTDQGQTLPPEHEALVKFDREGNDDLSYRDAEREARLGRILRGLPVERRVALLMDRMRTEKYPLRPMAFLGDDAPASVWDEAVRAMIERRKSLQDDELRLVHQRGGEAFLGALERNMALSGGDATFLSSLRNALPHQVYLRMEQALGGAKETERDALLRLAREAPGDDRVRIYVLQRVWDGDDKGYTTRPGSLTVSGGRAPGLDDAAIPKDDAGEPLAHLFTLDFDDFPELRAHWPGARAVAFFCPEPDRGERYDETVWVPVPAGAPAGESDGDPIAVVPLDVPSSVFGRSKDPAIRVLRKEIHNAAGHVLGEPFWIQGEEPEGGAWVMQVNEGLCEANTGDAGSLYLYTDGTTFQCH